MKNNRKLNFILLSISYFVYRYLPSNNENNNFSTIYVGIMPNGKAPFEHMFMINKD